MVYQRLKIGRQRGGEGEDFFGARMRDGEAFGVQHLARRGECGARAAIDLVADNGMVDVGEVYADLMGASGFDSHAQERGRAEGLHYFIAGEGFFPARVAFGVAEGEGGHFFAVAIAASDPRVDGAGCGARGAPGEGDIFLLRRAIFELVREGVECAVILGDDHDAARVAVESVDDAGPLLAADSGEVGAVVEEGVDEGSRLVAWRGVHDEVGGLVDDDEVVILEEDVEGDVFRHGFHGDRWRSVPRDEVAGADAHFAAAGLSVHGHAVGFDFLLPARAGELGSGAGQDGVESADIGFAATVLTGFGHIKRRRAGGGQAAGRARKRSATARTRPTKTSARLSVCAASRPRTPGMRASPRQYSMTKRHAP